MLLAGILQNRWSHHFEDLLTHQFLLLLSLLVLQLLYAVVSLVSAYPPNPAQHWDYTINFASAMAAYALLLFCAYWLWMLVQHIWGYVGAKCTPANKRTSLQKHQARFICLLPDVCRDALAPLTTRNVLTCLLIVSSLLLMGYRFAYLKNHILAYHHGVYDQVFMNIDRWLFGGQDPWQLMRPYLTFDTVVWADKFYAFWFFLLGGANIWFSFSQNDERRDQYFLAFTWSWLVLGLGVAFVLASMGPCFYNRMPGLYDAVYHKMNVFLQHADAVTGTGITELQNTLWSKLQSHTYDMVSGISAMPSMHVAIAYLWAAAFWREYRWLGALLFIYTGLVVISTVMLGWHYLVDSIVAIVGAAIMYWLSGRAYRYFSLDGAGANCSSSSFKSSSD